MIVVGALIPPPDSITPIGMTVLGIFLGMIYLFSSVGPLWPSILGIFLLACTGIGGDAGFNGVWQNSMGNFTVLLTLFAMILFGAVDEVGDTLYMAR